MLFYKGGRQADTKAIDSFLVGQAAIAACRSEMVPHPDGDRCSVLQIQLVGAEGVSRPSDFELTALLENAFPGYRVPTYYVWVEAIPSSLSSPSSPSSPSLLSSPSSSSEALSTAFAERDHAFSGETAGAVVRAGTAAVGLGKLWRKIYRNWNENVALWGIDNNGSVYVGVGDEGKYWTSTDGFHWTRGANFRNPHYGICWARNKFVIGGSEGIIRTSPTGLNGTWTQRDSKIDAVIKDIHYASALNWVMAVGTNGNVALSKDGGVTYQAVKIGGASTIQGVTYGNGKWVACGANGYVFTSADGVNWSGKKVSIDHLYTAVYGTPGGSPMFVTAGYQGRIYSSPDGVNWTRRSGEDNKTFLFRGVWTGSIFTLIGEYSNTGPFVAPVLISADGKTWTAHASNAYNAMLGLTYDSKRKRLVGSGAWSSVIYSDDTAKSLEITAPVSGNWGDQVVWNGGSKTRITWKYTGSPGRLQLLYSPNGLEGEFRLIAENLDPAAGGYDWTLPQTDTENCVLKLGEMDGSPSVYSLPFSIKKGIVVVNTLKITSPNGGEHWQPGTMQRVTWTSTGDVGRVRLRYSANGGVSWVKFADNITDNGSYNWTVPNLSSGNCLVRINEVNAAGLPFDISDGAFTIGTPLRSLVLTAPNGGEELHNGDRVTVTWTSMGNVGPLRLYFSSDAGASWVLAADKLADTGSYSWTAPELTSQLCLMKLVAIDHPASLVDVSNAFFSITITVKPELTILRPVPGEKLIPGAVYPIAWNSSGVVNRLRFRYSADGGNSWVKFAENVEDNGVMDWTVPAVNSDMCLLRVNEINSSGLPFTVSHPFTIGVPSAHSLILTAPNGGEVLKPGTTFTVSWKTVGNVQRVRLRYSADGGASWIKFADNLVNEGEYRWAVPTGIDSENCLIRINEVNSTGIPFDVGDATFTIGTPVPHSLSLTSPNGGEVLKPGTPATITWNTGGDVRMVRLRYSIDNGASWVKFADNLVNEGNYRWTVPSGIDSETCLLRINEVNGSGLPFDVSDAPFTIGTPEPHTLTLTAPNGGEVLVPGNIFPITWNSGGKVERVRLRYSVDSGASWDILAENVSNLNRFDWRVPETESQTCLVRINEVNTSGVPFDVADGFFTIALPVPRTLTLTAPNGGEQFIAGVMTPVTWTATGDIRRVRLQLSVDGGATWSAVAETIENNGRYDWRVPETASGSCLMRIQEANDAGSPVDVCDGPFSIALPIPHTLTLTEPNGGEHLTAGTVTPITWNFTGDIRRVRLQYSIDGGGTWILIVQDLQNTGAFDWTIPDLDSDSCLIRIDEFNEAGLPFDLSDAPFSVQPAVRDSLTLIAPNGGEQLTSGTPYVIKWSFTGNITSIGLLYSGDNGVTWQVITGAAPNNGQYAWVVPDIDSTRCLLRIEGGDGNGGPGDTSDAAFTVVKPKVINPGRKRLIFGYVIGGEPPAPITFSITNSGGGLLHLNIAADVPWVAVSPTIGVGNAEITVTANPDGLPIGTGTGIITISEPDAINSPITLPVKLTVKDKFETEEPFGVLETPASAAVVRGAVTVSGWALARHRITALKVYVDRLYVGDAVFVEGARPDILEKYPEFPDSHRAGWALMVLTNFLPNGGNGDYVISVEATDTKGKVVELGRHAIKADNKHAVKPFGTIDTPVQGGVVSGTEYINWGWALTPQPNTIPADGSTILVWIDGKPLGNPNYNIHRRDIASLFPGYNNSDGAVGYFKFDTTRLSNGVHQIAWSVRDNAGNVEGIGSRYFIVDNPLPRDEGHSPETHAREARVSQLPDAGRLTLRVKNGFQPWREIKTHEGIVHADLVMHPLERLEIAGADGVTVSAGYLHAAGHLEALPVGAGIDLDSGAFYWQLGPGYMGEYLLVLVVEEKNGNRKKISLRVKIS